MLYYAQSYLFIEVSDKIQVKSTLDHALNLFFQTVPHAVHNPKLFLSII